MELNNTFANLEIVKRKVVKPEREPFKKTAIGSVKGKSSKYLTDVIIPYYQRQISNLKRDLKLEKAKKKKIALQNKGTIKNIRNASWREKKKMYAITNQKLNERARLFYFDKIKAFRLNSCNYIDGAIAFPILKQWGLENNFNHNYLSLFIIVSCHNWFLIKDADYFGHTRSHTYRVLGLLKESGLLSTFKSGHSNAYVLTIEGEKILRKFLRYYTLKTRKLFRELDKKEPKRFGSTEVKTKIRGKFKKVEKINLIKDDGDQEYSE